MIKPITLMRQEFIDKQAELMAESGLPAFILIEVYEKLLKALRGLEERQYQEDKAAWEAQRAEIEKEVPEGETE